MIVGGHEDDAMHQVETRLTFVGAMLPRLPGCTLLALRAGPSILA